MQWMNCYVHPLQHVICTKTPNSYAYGSESHSRKLLLHYGDFVQANSYMVDKTAGQLQLTLHVNKTSTKAFEPRTTCILAKLL